jgi:hypothetical protein
MFAVFAEAGTGNEVTGRGDTPQLAWESMLDEFALEESDIDLDTVEFFELVNVNQETRTTWTLSEPYSDE